MKILYIGSERSDAQAVATALQGVEGEVSVSWASRVETTTRWLDQNPDIAALVVEAQTQADGWPSFLTHVRGLASRPAVVVIVGDETGPRFESLYPDADDYIARNHSLFHDLPIVVTRAVARARGHEQLQHALNGVTETHKRLDATAQGPHVNPRRSASAAPAGRQSQLDGLLDLERAARADVEQRLAHATAALRDAEQRHVAAMAAAGEQLAERQAQYEIGMARSAATWDMVDEQLRAAAAEVERARQNQASAAADVDRLSRRELELSSQLAEAAATHRALERRLADAETAVEEARSRTEHERLAAAEQSAERQRELQAQIAREVDKRGSLDELFAQAVNELDEAEKRHASAMTDAAARTRESEAALRLAGQDLESKVAEVERLTRRETDLRSTLADVTTGRNDLERRLAATEAAFEDATTRATRERLTVSKQAAEREAELDAQIQLERATRAALEQTIADGVVALRDAHVALRDGQQRHDVALAEAATELAARQAHFDGELSRAATDRERLTQRLSEAKVALDQVRRNHQSAATDVERLTQRERDLTSQVADAQAARHTLDLRLADAESAITHAAEREAGLSSQLADVQAGRHTLELRLADATSAITHAAKREAELDGQIRGERAMRATLEQAIADGEATLRDAQQRHDAALAVAATALAERQAHFDRELSQTVADRDRLKKRLSDAKVALDQVRRDHQLAAADVERLTQHEADLTSQMAAVQSARVALEAQLANSARAIAYAAERETDLTRQVADGQAARHTLELQLASAANAIRHAAERETELDGQIQQERVTRATLEQTIADGVVALRDAQQLHDVALETAATELAGRQAAFDRELKKTVTDRDRLAQRLSDAEVVLAEVRRDHQLAAADVQRLTQREDELTSQAVDAQAARHTLELRLAIAASAISHAAERETELDEQVQQERVTRATLEQTIADGVVALRDAHVALRDGQQRHEAALAAAATELAERHTHFDRELSQIAAERDRLTQRLSDAESALEQVRRDHELAVANVERLTQHKADLTSQLADGQAARDTLELRVADLVSAIADADERATRERDAAADLRTDLEARIAQAIATRNTLERTLTETRSAALDAERSHREEADALRARGVEQEARFEVRFAQERLEHEGRLAEMQEYNRTLSVERDALQQSLSTIQEQSLPRLHQQLDESRAESNRLFDQAGLAMFRCAPDGALIQANRACATLIGRRMGDELDGGHFAAAVFEVPTILSWLIERSVSTRAKESIETTWRRKDGGRLFVRLSARSTASDAIEITAEDLTRLRVLEERLGQAHRMEAVGRFASEVAVTCGNLLNDIHQKGREWLMTASRDADSRQQGEQLLDEVRRAAGFLWQLAACGDEQARTPMLVDLNTLIRDLEPVLKRVAGGDVDIQLQDTSSLNVDVGTERVERLLVNLASYGRERMPFGGRLKIELGTSVVDRHFAAKHPNVRLGLHALITVTEIRHAGQADGPEPRRDRRTTHSSREGVAQKTGVDFATLQGLVNECGGHLWMQVQPLGDMVAKIRLPLLSPQDQKSPRALATRLGRERSKTRWFHA